MSAIERTAVLLGHLGGVDGTSNGPTAAAVSGNAEHFQSVPLAPPDSILGINIAFRADASPNKLNLGVGAYRTEEGKPYVLNVVKKVERMILEDPTVNKEYLPIDGLPQFTSGAARVILGDKSPAVREGRLVSVQALGGTGALRLGGAFLQRFYARPIYIPTPTWGNHKQIFDHAGLEVRQYQYYDKDTRGLKFTAMIGDLEAAPFGSVILLHACAHNPTGVDPSLAQWQQIADVMLRKGHIAFFDSAYQGFASGSLERDAAAIRHFVDVGVEMVVAQSFSKNMGFYGERVGCLHVIPVDTSVVEKVQSQVKIIVRAMYSNPPVHGALVASRILNDKELFAEWVAELAAMSARLLDMRTCLHAELGRIGCPGDWSHVINQIGMFTFLGITSAQVKQLTAKHHIYLTGNGRISVAGLSRKTVPFLANALLDVVNNY
mmetsp:Transcript_20215/g.77404  ORF Transcript_20215/g.77404 Transcript_20215/m.77404 type:complete len:435 (-) Transcript_20215:78-1382(-)